MNADQAAELNRIAATGAIVTIPAGYTLMDSGWSCRCVLMQTRDGNNYCCGSARKHFRFSVPMDEQLHTPLAPSIPMILNCPACGARHVDAGRFATHPHHTHACQQCGMVWRPAIVPTVGVQFLPGFKDPTDD